MLSFKILFSDSGVVAGSSLLGCYVMLPCKYVMAFQRLILPSLSYFHKKNHPDCETVV